MHASDRVVKGLRLVTSKLTNRSWLETWEGKRITPKFRIRSMDETGPYVVLNTKNDKTFLYHKQLNYILLENNIGSWMHSISDSLYWIRVAEKVAIFNDRGIMLNNKFVYVGDLKNGFCRVMKDCLWGFIDDAANVVIPPIYEDVEPFNEWGYAVVTFKDSKKTAVIDKKGTYIFAPTNYSNIEFLTKDLLKVTKDRLCGVINLKGEVIVSPFYSDVCVKGNFFEVKRNKKHGLLNLDGSIVFECIYPEIIETPDKFVVQDFAKQEVSKTKETRK